MKQPTPFIGVLPELLSSGGILRGTGSVNFVALSSKCGVPCLAGEIDDNNRPEIRCGEYKNGEPVCDPCYNREPEDPNTLEKQYQRIMKKTYTFSSDATKRSRRLLTEPRAPGPPAGMPAHGQKQSGDQETGH